MSARADRAPHEGARALVTGESLGQVASQTLENLDTIDRAVDMPILRPLVGMSKLEIVNEAKRIGTFETSILASSIDADLARKADLNRDGRIDVRDVIAFEKRHGLPDTLSTELLLAEIQPRKR